MDAPRWTIKESDDVRKSKKKYKSDKPVCDSFDKHVKMLIRKEDPADVAYEKTKDGIFINRLTKSIRLAYWMDYEEKIIYLASLGDHKKVYGGD